MLELMSHSEMCHREGRNLQQGMNYLAHSSHSIILMSLQKNAPYDDRMLDESTILYEGHNVPRVGNIDPKTCDQPRVTDFGSPTENGKFFNAAKAFLNHGKEPRRVCVYEKIRPNIWSYNGTFHLVDAWLEDSNSRKVFKFKLTAVEGEEIDEVPIDREAPHRRLIPSQVKLEVFKRDEGKCIKCSSKDQLHYDHDLPFSRGGSSLTAENVRLLCSRHNLEKSNKIE